MRNLTTKKLIETKTIIETNLRIIERGLKEFDKTYYYLGDFINFEEVIDAFTDKVEETIEDLKNKLVEVDIILDERKTH